jgi:signal transduction histidine kinase
VFCPSLFSPKKKSRLRFDEDRIQIQSRHGHHAVLVQLEQGRIGFYLVRPSHDQKKLKFVGILFLVFISLIMVASFFAIGWVLRPIRWLKQGVDAVGRGKLSHRVPLKRRDELRDLSQAFNDMTERLGRLIKAKEQLLLDVSHELRSPITRIKVALAMLPEDDSRKGITDDLDEIDTKITELLETARSLGVKAELNRISINLEDLLRRVANPFDNLPPGVVIHPLPGPVSILADEDQLSKALKNVIDNAVKYSQPGSASVDVRVDLQGKMVEIAVRDYGIGIPAEDLEFVFEPFYRVDKARSPDGQGGYGLGLSLVKTVVDAHNGTVEIASELGQGTSVKIVLPRA